MAKCEDCNKNVAIVTVADLNDKAVYLCASCAEKKQATIIQKIDV